MTAEPQRTERVTRDTAARWASAFILANRYMLESPREGEHWARAIAAHIRRGGFRK